MTKTFTIVTTLLLLLGGFSAAADAYTASVASCQKAIGEKLGVSQAAANYDIQKVRTKSRYRDIKFSVSAYDASNPLQGVKAKCRSRRNGEILAIEFDPDTLPSTIAVK